MDFFHLGMTVAVFLCFRFILKVCQRKSLASQGIALETLDTHSGTLIYHGKSTAIAEIRWQLIAAMVFIPAGAIIVSNLIIHTAIEYSKRHAFLPLSLAWYDDFAKSEFIQGKNLLDSFLVHGMQNLEKLYVLGTSSGASLFLSLTAIFGMAGVSLLMPTSRKSLGFTIIQAIYSGSKLSARDIRIREILCTACLTVILYILFDAIVSYLLMMISYLYTFM